MHQAGAIKAETGRHAFAALILANVFLAFGPWLVRLADVGPVASGFWRLALAIPLLLLIVAHGHPRGVTLTRGVVAALVLGGLFFAADLAAWHGGIVRTKLANATLFGNMSSFIYAGYGFLLVRSLPRGIQGVAFAVALAGSALLLGSSYDLSPEHLVGDLLALLAAVFYGLYLIAIQRARRSLGAMPALALATIAGAIPLLILAVATGEKVMPDDWTPLILLSLGSQVIGQGLLVYAMGHLTPLVIGIALLTQPAITAVTGWLAYDETFGAADLVGALLISAALVLIRLPARKPCAASEGSASSSP